MLPVENCDSLGIYIDFDLCAQDAIRKSKNIMDQLKVKLLHRVFPSRIGVRGNSVGADSLIEALAGHGSMGRYELFTHPSAVAKLTLRLQNHWRIEKEKVRISSVRRLLQRWDSYRLTSMLLPHLGSSIPYRLRGYSSSENVPIICLTHGFSLHAMLYDTFLPLLLARTYSCDSLICSSRASHTAMSNILGYVSEQFGREHGVKLNFSGRIDRLPLCVDTDVLEPKDQASSRRRFRLPVDGWIILYFGTVSLLKADLLPLISSFWRLVRKNTKRKLCLVIAGSGDAPYFEILRRIVRQLGLDKNVRFIRDIPDDMKAFLYSSADVYLAPSDSIQESFGLTPTEAMACGVPQVAANWNGYRDIVEHGETGFLLPTYWTQCDRDLRMTGSLLSWEFDHLCIGQSVAIDLEALQCYLQKLIDNDELRREMSARSRKRAKSLFSYRVVARQYEDLSRELSQLASSITFDPFSADFEMPDYFRCFKSHPSKIVTDDSIVTMMPLGREPYGKELFSIIDGASRNNHAVNAELIRDALEHDVWRPASGEVPPSAGKITFAELIEHIVSGRCCHPDLARRNVMWLVKQGYLGIESSDEHS